VRITALYYIGLIFLVFGIFYLSAQDDNQQADNPEQPAAQSNVTVETSSGVSAATSSQTSVSEPSAASVIETNASAPTSGASKDEAAENGASGAKSAGQARDSGSPAGVSAEKSEAAEPAQTTQEDRTKAGAVADLEKEKEKGEAKEADMADFAVERAKPSAETNRPASGEKRSFWGRLFGSGKKSAATAAAAEEMHSSGPGTNQPAATDRQLTAAELFAAQEEVRRQAKEVESLKRLDEAYQAMSRNEFDEALDIFSDALGMMPVRPHTVETRQKARMSEAECEYRLALQDYRDGRVDEAKKAISRALEYYPQHVGAARLTEKIKQDETRKAKIDLQPVPLRKSPEYLSRQKTIREEMKRGREYTSMREYNKAEEEYKSVLIADPLNEAASSSLRKISEKRYDFETEEFERTKAEMLFQIRDAWTPPVKKAVVKREGVTGETMVVSSAQKRLEKKLDSIVMKKIDFQDASISDVVKFLNERSREYDVESPPGERGVNVIFRPRYPGRAAPAVAAPVQKAEAADLLTTEEAKPAAGAEGAEGVPRITLSLNDVDLRTALKYITENAGLKFRADDKAVVIYHADTVYGELETRTYKVFASMVEMMQGGGAAPAATPAEGEKLQLGGGSMGAGLPAERQDMKQFFVDAGVPFPEGTSIKYLPSQSLLIVKNTVENLEAMERLLGKINEPPLQVEIEARFVEIGQNDLEELGLEWLLTDNWQLAQKTGGNLPPSMRERVQMNKNDFTKGLRNFSLVNGQAVPQSQGTMAGLVSISSILTNPELTVILHALEQKDGANLLSAPKVTTKSGTGASIKVIEELIYPTAYDQNAQSIGTTTSGNQSLVQVIVTPSSFETRDVGVLLEVTPTVGPDKETIDLAMNPQVVELQEWIDYGSDVPTGDPTRTQHLSLNQPIFHSRQITTSISIWDGQTVVMGGLITETQQTTEDKIPFLGDIPLLGYLFKSKTSNSVKKNLLIFVTANLVDPAGNKIKKGAAAASLAAAGESITATANP